jgi:PIN domain nuclease of toxin-antitoxin system
MLPKTLNDVFKQATLSGGHGFTYLYVTYGHALKAGGLLVEQRGSLDQMPAAQAITEGATLVTNDAR